MKRFVLLVFLAFFTSCKEEKMQFVEQEIIDGKVSATEKGIIGGRFGHPPYVWVQNNKTTRKVEIPFEHENRWKVGDSCLLIIEKYKVVSDEKN